MIIKRLPSLPRRSSLAKLYATLMLGRLLMKRECHESALGEESGGFLFDPLFCDDHQVDTVPAGYVSG